jgi:hypothetical protein
MRANAAPSASGREKHRLSAGIHAAVARWFTKGSRLTMKPPRAKTTPPAALAPQLRRNERSHNAQNAAAKTRCSVWKRRRPLENPKK